MRPSLGGYMSFVVLFDSLFKVATEFIVAKRLRGKPITLILFGRRFLRWDYRGLGSAFVWLNPPKRQKPRLW